MKFLLVLTVLVSSGAFAQGNFEQIRCFEPFDQSQDRQLAYIFRETGSDQVLHIVFPDNLPNPVKRDEANCLVHPSVGSGPSNEVTFCAGQGQNMDGLVPVSVTPEGETESETVYCEAPIEDWFTTLK